MQYSEKFKKDCIILGKNIEQFRKIQNITLKELSQKTNINLNYLKKIEQGTAYGVKLSAHLLKIAKAFNLELHDLFVGI